MGGERGVEERIAEWRANLVRGRAIGEAELAELEHRLRGQVASLIGVGLAADEALLIAVNRVGAAGAPSPELVRERWDGLWRHLITGTAAESPDGRWREAVVALALAGVAAALVKLPEPFGYTLEAHPDLYARNVGPAVFALVAGYFAWKRALSARTIGALAATFALAALAINLQPFEARGDTLILAVLHLPIALWMVVGVAFAGGHASDCRRRMDFIRFSGELFIHYVLIALGGGVLMMLTVAIFESIGADAGWFVARWLLPCGAVGAVIVASWLVEAKESVIGNLAPVLARLFTPLFAAVLVSFLATMVWTARGIDVGRDVLIAFDLVLVLVLGLLLYTISAREPGAPAGGFDWLLLVLVVGALLVDALALGAIVSRISDFGFTPNRVAALGENLILLVNLAWSAWLYARFLAGWGTFRALERWQTGYLPVYAAWAAVVVLLFPPLFGFS